MSLTKNEIKFVKSLQQKKFRDEHQMFIVEGEKMIHELFLQSKFKIKTVYHLENYILPETNLKFESCIVGKSDLERISGFKTPNKVLAVVYQNTKTSPLTDDFILALDEVKDPGNMGTIIRTADWFGIKTIITSPTSVEIYNPKVVQSSMGAIFRIEIKEVEFDQTLLPFSNPRISFVWCCTRRTIYV